MGYCRSRAFPVRCAFGVICSNPDTNTGNRSVTRSYYRGAAGVILVYDITKLVHLLVFTVFTHSFYWQSRFFLEHVPVAN